MKDRILVLSHVRSGSTQYYNAFTNHHRELDPSFIQCMSEVQAPPNNNFYDPFFKKYNLDRNKLANEDPNEMTKAFLCAFKNDKFMMKYFPKFIRDRSIPITSEIIIKRCLAYDTEVHFLYRKNILNTLISYMVSLETRLWHNDQPNPISINFEDIKINTDILNNRINYFCAQIEQVFMEYELFNNAGLVRKVMTYEDHIVTGNYMYAAEKIKHRRMNSDESKNIVLKNNPKIIPLLLTWCEKYNLAIDSNYDLIID